MVIASFQKLVFNLMYAMIVLFLWNRISNRSQVQEYLHKLGGWVFQWYTLMLALIVGMSIAIFGQIFIQDCYATQFLDPAVINATFLEKGLTDDEMAQLQLPPWLRWLSLSSVIAGLVGLSVLFVHFLKQMRKNHSEAVKQDFKYPWKFSVPEEMLSVVILTPAIFILMSMKSTSRMWMVMRAFHTGEDAKTDLALFDENFELASICQYVVVFMFARLCFFAMKMESQNKDITTAMSLVGFQGVYGWIIVGCVHSVVVFFVDYMAHNYNQYGLTKAQIDGINAFVPQIDVLFSLSSLQCTYNMVVVCRLPLLKGTLGNPTLKFNGTKLLLLIGPNQLSILQAMSAHVSKNKLEDKVASILDLTPNGAMLLHSSLMCYECLIVIILNAYAWRDIRHGVGNKLFYAKLMDDEAIFDDYMQKKELSLNNSTS